MKHLGLVIDEQLHKNAKLEAVKRGITLTDYICDLIRKDLEKNNGSADRGKVRTTVIDQ